jgi:BolA protein
MLSDGILMTRAARLQKILAENFNPAQVEILDDSPLHAGHAGAQPGGGTHYRVTIVSKLFATKSRMERHRMVNEAVKEEFAGGLHALQLILKTPEEMT